MIIRDLKYLDGNSSANVHLTYDEIMCIVNSLNTLSEVAKIEGVNPVELHFNFNEVYSDFIQLSALVKHGRLCDDHIKTIHNLLFEDELDD